MKEKTLKSRQKDLGYFYFYLKALKKKRRSKSPTKKNLQKKHFLHICAGRNYITAQLDNYITAQKNYISVQKNYISAQKNYISVQKNYISAQDVITKLRKKITYLCRNYITAQ